MPDRPVDAPPLTVWLFPGASVMTIERLPEGLVTVRCPGCDAVMSFFGPPPQTFMHESDSCPILRRIQAAVACLQAAMQATVEMN